MSDTHEPDAAGRTVAGAVTSPGADAADQTASDQGQESPPTLPDLSGAVSHRTISANGIRFHLAESGRAGGPLVVLLHGFGQFWFNWRHQLAGLADTGYRVVAMDLRGAGDSDKPPRGYDAFTLADDIAGLIGALGDRQAVLVGQGYGGTLAFNAAILHPARIRGVVAVAAPHPAQLARFLPSTVHSDHTNPLPWSMNSYRRLVTFAAAPIAPHRRLAASAGAMLERLLRNQAGPAWVASADFAATVERMRRAIVAPGAAKGAVEMLRWVARSPWRADGRRHRLALESLLTAPVLHLAGEGDAFTPVSVLQQTADLCAGPYALQIIPGVGHYPAEEAPEGFNAAVSRFLDRRMVSSS